MDLFEAPIVDVRPLLTEERKDLLGLLRSLSAAEWRAETAAPDWSVKDVALHLLDDDLGWLSRDRDGDRSGLLSIADHDSFVAALAAKNQRWIDGAKGLSAEVIIDLLEWAGREMDAYYSTTDLNGRGEVSWASDGPVPTWFDIAQDLTERWVHQMQIREALDRVGGYASSYGAEVLRTFVWGLPYQYRVDAAPGTTVQLDLAAGGSWRLTCERPRTWVLDEGLLPAPDARAAFSDDAAWRWLTGAAVPADGVIMTGPAHLCEPLLDVRGIIV